MACKTLHSQLRKKKGLGVPNTNRSADVEQYFSALQTLPEKHESNHLQTRTRYITENAHIHMPVFSIQSRPMFLHFGKCWRLYSIQNKTWLSVAFFKRSLMVSLKLKDHPSPKQVQGSAVPCHVSSSQSLQLTGRRWTFFVLGSRD